MELAEILQRYHIGPEESADILRAFEVQSFGADAEVFRQGDRSDAFYFVRSGRALVIRASPAGEDSLAVLKEGEFFGEAGVLADAERTATVRSADALEVGRMDGPTFRRLVAGHQGFREVVQRISRHRLLRQGPLFRELDEESLAAVAGLLVEEDYPEEAVVFEEGDWADALYILAKGGVRVSKRTRWGREVAVAFLGQGECFGELGLIERERRSATVVTTCPCRMLVLGFDAFQDLLKGNALASLGMLKVLSRRMRETTREVSRARGMSFFKGITIVCRAERCLSCRACEIACAVAKSRSRELYGAIGEEPTPVRRIHVRRSTDGTGAVIRPEHCLQCRNAPCLASCKLKAIRRDVESGTVLITDKCVGCGRCVKACPHSVITLIGSRKGKRVALKCTHCAEYQSGPACVRSCPTNALMIALSPMSPAGEALAGAT